MIQIENCTLYQGDCLDLMKEIPEKSIDMILCDLPYGILDVNNETTKWDTVIPFEPLWKEYKRIRKDNAAIILFGKQPFTTILNSSNIEEFKYEIIWKKHQATNPMCAKKRIMPIHENISVFYKEQSIYNPQMRYGHKCYNSYFNKDKIIGEIYGSTISSHRQCIDGSRYPISVIEFKNNNENILHPTQKPVALLEYLIKTYTNENMVVLDNCMGSGSTGVACINTKRKFIGIELDQNYFNIAKKRIEDRLKQQELF